MVSKQDLHEAFLSRVDEMVRNESIKGIQRTEILDNYEKVGFFLGNGLKVAPFDELKSMSRLEALPDYNMHQLADSVINCAPLGVVLNRSLLLIECNVSPDAVGAASVDTFALDIGSNDTFVMSSYYEKNDNSCISYVFNLSDDAQKITKRSYSQYKDLSFFSYGDFVPFEALNISLDSAHSEHISALVSDFLVVLSQSEKARESERFKQKIIEEIEIFNDLKRRIIESDSWVCVASAVLPEIQATYFNDPSLRASLAKAVQSVYESHNKVDLLKSDAKNMVKFKRVLVESDVSHSLNEWCKDVVYINGSGFACKKTREKMQREEFNLRYTKFVPANDGGKRQPAYEYVSNGGLIDFVAGEIYWPKSNESIVDRDGKKYLNLYDATTRPRCPSAYSCDGARGYVQHLQKHLFYLCNQNKEYESILTQWIAWQFQCTGLLNLFAPIIQGVQGIGKTLIADVLRVGLGSENVGTVTTDQIKEKYGDFATGKAVNFIEEIKVSGQTRHDTANRLKPYITNATISIRPFGGRTFDTDNTCNYAGFSNYKMMLPIDNAERRYWILFCELSGIDELEDIAGMDRKSYFSRLFDGLYRYRHDIAHYFTHEVVITDYFKNLKQAPETIYKQVIIDTDNAKVEGLDEVKALISTPSMYWNDKAICASKFITQLRKDNPFLDLNDSEVRTLLARLGYQPSAKQVKVHGYPYTVWTTKVLSNDQIRHALKK